MNGPKFDKALRHYELARQDAAAANDRLRRALTKLQNACAHPDCLEVVCDCPKPDALEAVLEGDRDGRAGRVVCPYAASSVRICPHCLAGECWLKAAGNPAACGRTPLGGRQPTGALPESVFLEATDGGHASPSAALTAKLLAVAAAKK